jgi:trehalose 6-phosphate synthase
MNLIVVSNRLPFVFSRDAEGAWRLEPGSGGLVTALRPVLRDRGGRWIGWTGVTEEELPDATPLLAGSERRFGYTLIPVGLSSAERDGFYYGFSNEIVWPLFHDLTPSRFDPSYWAVYESVNQKFADVTAQNAGRDDFIWVHDYHLIRLGGALRERGLQNRIAFFLHIPFPPLDIFLKLPWRFQVMRSLLQYDLIGFQTVRDRRNFAQCLRLLFRDAEITGKGAVWTVFGEGRHARVGSFPISIDVQEFERRVSEAGVLEKTQSLRRHEAGRKIILGIDRLDYTKGIPQKLEAFRTLLTRYPELRGRVTLFQIVVPSREDIPRYRDHKVSLERLVGEINGRFTTSGWVPIHYIYRSLEGVRLPAYYRAADIAFVTPLKDGMNLVAKEYCASRVDEDGVLVLSEFAGAAAQLQKGAFLVNPFDEDGVADTLYRAVGLPAEERRSRMRKLRRAVREYDIYRWLDTFLAAAISKELADFPRVEDYLPESAAQ